MKKINKLSILIFIGVIFGENKRLSFEDVQGKSPFKYASLGFIDWLPNENAYLIKSKDQILKVTVPNLDTTVFLAKTDFEIVGKNVLQSKNSDKAAPWVQTVYQNWEELIKSSTF